MHGVDDSQKVNGEMSQKLVQVVLQERVYNCQARCPHGTIPLALDIHFKELFRNTSKDPPLQRVSWPQYLSSRNIKIPPNLRLATLRSISREYGNLKERYGAHLSTPKLSRND